MVLMGKKGGVGKKGSTHLGLSSSASPSYMFRNREYVKMPDTEFLEFIEDI